MKLYYYSLFTCINLFLLHCSKLFHPIGLQIQPSSEIKVPVGSTISVVCVSLVPGISIEWSVDASNGSALVIPNVNNSLENTEYCCDVIDELSIFPEEAESFLCLTLLVFPCKFYNLLYK